MYVPKHYEIIFVPALKSPFILLFMIYALNEYVIRKVLYLHDISFTSLQKNVKQVYSLFGVLISNQSLVYFYVFSKYVVCPLTTNEISVLLI